MATSFRIGNDIIDTRDIQERIEELEGIAELKDEAEEALKEAQEALKTSPTPSCRRRFRRWWKRLRTHWKTRR